MYIMFKLLNIWFQWKKRRRSNFKTPKHLNILFAISIQTWLAVPHTAIECNINVKLKFPYKHKSHWMWYKRRRLRYTYTFVACTSGTWMRMGIRVRVCVCAHALCFILPDWSWISMRHCTFTLFWSKKAFSCIYCFWYRLNRLWNHIWSLFRWCILLYFKMKREIFKWLEFVKSWEMHFVHFFFSSKRNIALYSAIYHRTENTFKRIYIKCTNVVMSLCKCIR